MKEFAVVEGNLNMTVPWYLMAAYVYYQLDDQLITDAEFDQLAKTMLENWSTIEHRHKHLITKGDLEAGTLLLTTGDYPEMTRSSALHLLAIKQEEEKRKPKARKTN